MTTIFHLEHRSYYFALNSSTQASVSLQPDRLQCCCCCNQVISITGGGRTAAKTGCNAAVLAAGTNVYL